MPPRKDQKQEIVLASTSPRRKELMESSGFKIKVLSPDADESLLPSEDPVDLVKRLALAKAKSVSVHYPQSWVIGADTIVVRSGEILNKPADESEARAMLRKISGVAHQVWGGVALVRESSKSQDVRSFVTEVAISDLSDEFIDWYIATGEPLDKAGAYGAQGIGKQFITKIIGSYTNVVGLDMAGVCEMLSRNGVLS